MERFFYLNGNTILYHGTYLDKNYDFEPTSIQNNSNFAIIPWKVCLRYARCSEFNQGIIHVYKTNKVLKLLDLDQFKSAGYNNSIQYFNALVDNYGLRNNLYGQDDLKRHVCELYDGYKWLNHEDEIVISNSSAIDYIESITCDEAKQLKTVLNIQQIKDELGNQEMAGGKNKINNKYMKSKKMKVKNQKNKTRYLKHKKMNKRLDKLGFGFDFLFDIYFINKYL